MERDHAAEHMSHPPTPQEFRWIPEGKGGTFTLDPTSDTPRETLPHFGTYDCHTCVGLYLPLDARRCCVAHINCTLVVRHGWNGDGPWTWIVDSEADATQIRERVKGLLTAESRRAGWGEVSAEAKAGLVLVCPKIVTDAPGVCPKMATGAPGGCPGPRRREVRWVGYYVAAGIREWLGVPEVDVETQYGGFVVRHPEGVVTMLARDDVEGIKGGLLLGSKAWVRREETGANVTQWSILLPKSS
ncbi:hypothetical protein LTR53_016864 [Teratosphaeriaceae sp. CCFEE 6253]|nr:hypothetical protein LTR53_016864 [Teratosphaeriaceae sp. CCFEE 6253]